MSVWYYYNGIKNKQHMKRAMLVLVIVGVLKLAQTQFRIVDLLKQ